MRTLSIHKEIWPLKKPFVIARTTMLCSYIVSVELQEGNFIGRGECEAHESDPAYLETIEEEIESIRADIEAGISYNDLQNLLPAGPARNAVDCALWDLHLKKTKQSFSNLMKLPNKPGLVTAQTLGISEGLSANTVSEEQIQELKDYPLLKLKLNSNDILERVAAIHHIFPQANLIIDANESWSFNTLKTFASDLNHLGVCLIEQPLKKGDDHDLIDYDSPIPLCADESCTDRNSLPSVLNKYQFINIKLDKTGGLTEAFALAQAAKDINMKLMVGCMVGTSLAMAPAWYLGQLATYCDLDGPSLLAKDRLNPIQYNNGKILQPAKHLWG